jgi:hypothetical protein
MASPVQSFSWLEHTDSTVSGPRYRSFWWAHVAAMGKQLVLCFGVLKTGKPFGPVIAMGC